MRELSVVEQRERFVPARADTELQLVRMNADENYAGVPMPVVVAIGKLMVSAGRVEHVADRIASAYNMDTVNLQFARTCREIRRALTRSVPPWVEASEQETVRWTEEAMRVMDRRNVIVHAVHAHRATSSGGWEAVTQNQRNNTPTAVNLDDFEDVLASLVELEQRGSDIERRSQTVLHEQARANIFAYATRDRDHHITIYYDVDIAAYGRRPDDSDVERMLDAHRGQAQQFVQRLSQDVAAMSSKRRESLPPFIAPLD